jgi:acid phosphatase type 7
VTITIVLAVALVLGLYVGRSAEAHHKPGHGQGNGGATPTTCNKGAFLAQYRNELRTFNTQPVLTRCETNINNEWGSGSPGSGVNTDLFTARWVGTFDFEASGYEFTATSDDGIRLWVDGQLLIDQWKDQGATTYKATKTMTAGAHEIKVEYYEYGGLAVAKVLWAKASSSSPPTSANDPVFVGAGDIANCSSLAGAEATAKLLDAIPGTVYTLGDNAYGSGTATEFANCYDPTWGRHKARTRPSPGNHEYYTSGGSGYFGYFGSAAGDPQKGYYSYDLGQWHVVVLNSNDQCRYVSCSAGSAQAQWLQADLAAHPAQCTLAYFHHPLFTSGNYSPGISVVKPLWEILYSGGAEVVLNGHDHLYERFAPQTPSGTPDSARGIREFVVGTGGAEHYGIKTVQPTSEVRNTGTFGVLKLTLHPTSYDWQFVPEAGKTFTDSGTTSCH